MTYHLTFKIQILAILNQYISLNGKSGRPGQITVANAIKAHFCKTRERTTANAYLFMRILRSHLSFYD